MHNELIFLLHVLLVSSGALLATRLGQCALVAYISLQAVLANLLVTKQTTLFGLDATCSDAYMIGAVLSLNLLQEYWGKQIAKSAIWTSFFLLIFYTLAGQLHLMYIPSALDTMHNFFSAILSPMPRLAIASISVYLFVQHLDAWLYGWLKTYWPHKHLVIRNYSSIAITQLVDTVLFSFLGLYGIIGNVPHIIIISYTIKIAALLIATPVIALSRTVVLQKN